MDSENEKRFTYYILRIGIGEQRHIQNTNTGPSKADFAVQSLTVADAFLKPPNIKQLRGEIMKKGMICLAFMIMVFCAATSYAQVSLNLMGPTAFKRDTGQPTTQTVIFPSDFGGPAALTLINGSAVNSSVIKISSATISLNGTTIFGPSDFNKNVTQLQKNVLLKKGSNALGVSLQSSPGGQVTIQMVQAISNVKATPSPVVLGEPGTEVQLKITGNLSNGTVVDITGSSYGTKYSSQNGGIATLTTGGLVTADALGRTTVSVMNTNFLASIPVTVRGTPPSISAINLSLNPIPVPHTNEQFIQSVTFTFANPDKDAKSFNATLSGPSGVLLSGSSALASDQITDTGARNFLIDSTYGEGVYQVGIEVLDAMGNSSGIHSKSFTIAQNAPRFLQITSIEPGSGRPGDQIVIKGIGFEMDPQANNVSFKQGLGRAQVVSATDAKLEVIIPKGVTTGTIGLMTSQGRTDSPYPFTIIPTASLSPLSTQLVTGGSTSFTCTPSGTPTYGIHWSATSGTVDNAGHFTAPLSVPSTNPITLTCTSTDDSTVYAEANITVVVPPPSPGQDLVYAAAGGQMTSSGGVVTITIPPGAMDANTIISVTDLDPVLSQVPADGWLNLAAADFEPEGLQFSQPVTASFSLRNLQAPGTVLNVYLVDSATGTLSDTGNTAIVDETGLTASTTLNHFSQYCLAVNVNGISTNSAAGTRKVPLVYFQYHASEYAPYFNQFSVHTSTDRPFLEGLVVPVEISSASQPGTLIGPLLSPGFSISAKLSNNTSLKVGPLVQPSGDGWKLGTTISLPVLPNCGEGETIGGNIVIDFQNFGLSAQAITIPFTVQCLDELSFSMNSPPKRVPPGASVVEVPMPIIGNVVIVKLLTGMNYRFSSLNIGTGGILSVNNFLDVLPANIEVTGNIDVQGTILAAGANGSPGGNGKDFDLSKAQLLLGGSGGAPGSIFGGSGGSGAPHLLGTLNGQQVYTGEGQQGGAGFGIGGAGGSVWEAGSAFSLVGDVYNLATDVVSIAASAGTDAMAWVKAIKDAYGTYNDGDKIANNGTNQLSSAGHGGIAAPGYLPHLDQFSIPFAGGGGGGAGMKTISWPDSNRAGGGGGGAGGSAPSLNIITAGMMTLSSSNAIVGTGGNGGHGGDGSGDAAPGGGGAGGNGAQIKISALSVINKGGITLKGGGRGVSGKIPMYVAGELFVGNLFIDSGFGDQGHNGVLRMEGVFNGNNPQDGNLYKPFYDSYQVSVASSSPFCSPSGSCFSLHSGLNSYAYNNAPSHPWQKEFVFYYPTPVDVSSNNVYILKRGDGNGVVTSAPSGMNCNNSSCLGSYSPGTVVTFQAVPSPGSVFNGWWRGDGILLSRDLTWTNNIVGDWTIIAYFYKGNTLTITKTGSGNGTITSLTSALNCGSTCQATFPNGNTVSLQANPLSDYYFAGWSGGGCSGNLNQCIVTLTADTTVTAKFEPLYTLSLNITGAGSVSVSNSPVGAVCDLTCQVNFIPGTVTLSATPSPGSYFAGWSGGGATCSGSSSLTCATLLTTSMAITAVFEIQQPLNLKSMNFGRMGHTATLLSDGRVLLAGGNSVVGEGYQVLSSAELYDPTTGIFTLTKGEMRTPRVHHTATLMHDGTVLIAGGGSPGNTAEIYDPATETFTAVTGGMYSARHGHTATLLNDGTVLIAGGRDDSDTDLSSAEFYYPNDGQFSPTYYGMRYARYGHTATLLNDGTVLIAGGDNDGTAEIYVPDIGRFGYATDVDPAGILWLTGGHRAKHTATLLPDGTVLITGGGYPGNTAEIHHPNRGYGFFEATGSMTSNRFSHTATLLNDGKILIAGGVANEDALSSADIYDPETGNFSLMQPMNHPRFEHTGTLLPNGNVLITGGGWQWTMYTWGSTIDIYDFANGTFVSPPLSVP